MRRDSMPLLHVLIVEDDPAVSSLTETVLNELDVKVIVATGVQEAQARLKRLKPPLLMIVDLLLGDGRGTELLEDLPDGVEAVMMTAYPDTDSAVAALRSGARDYLTKPVPPVRLRHLVTRWMEEWRLRIQNEQLETDLESRAGELKRLHYWTTQLVNNLQLDTVASHAAEAVSTFYRGRLVGVLRRVDHELEIVGMYPQLPVLAGDRRLPIELPAKAADFRTVRFDSSLRDGMRKHLGYDPQQIWPIIIHDKPFGLLVVFADPDLPYPHSDGTILQLLNVVQAALGNAVLHTELSELVVRDPFTMLYNHRYLRERLDDEIARAKRHDRVLSLIRTDLVGFRDFNRTHGTSEGDHALLRIAELLRPGDQPAVVSRVDITAREGSDEFALILPETNMKGALTTLEEICDRILKATDLKLCAGIAEYPRHGEDSTQIDQAALTALRHAEQLGPGSICTADDSN